MPRTEPVRFDQRPVDICVVAFSTDHSTERDHFPVIERCLGSIVSATDPRKYRLHLGCNNLSPRALALVDGLVAERRAKKYLGIPHRDRHGRVVYPKYPLMRTMFRATHADWVIWFDDDSHVIADDWLERLEATIDAHPDIDQFGKRRTILLSEVDYYWLQEFDWFDPAIGIPIQQLPNGLTNPGFAFIEGGHYALSRVAIEACGIPDPRLFHNRGDVATGLALRHRGFRIGNFRYGVAIDDAPRRGIHQDIWVPPDDPELAGKEWLNMPKTALEPGPGT